MLTVDVRNEKNAKIGQVDLPESVFAQPENKPLLHEATVLWLRNRRAGTAATKGRSLVSGGGKRPWKQKGTGRARAGSNRSPLWVGGGTIHGPQPRDYETSMPRKKRKAALRAALSLQYNAGNVLVLEGLALDKPSSARIASLLKALEVAGDKVLLVVPGGDENLEKSARNLALAHAIAPEALNPYVVLYHAKIVIFREALPRIEEIFG